MNRRSFVHALILALVCGTVAPAVADPARWEETIAKFEAADKENPPPPGGIVFIGSSSIRLWDTASAFPEAKVINRGFGGSEMEDSRHFADRIVIPYKPRLVAVYAGDNDLNKGKTPQRVLEDFKAFVAKVHAALPAARIIYIAVKPSIARWNIADKGAETNRLIRQFTQSDRRLAFADIWTPMLGDDGKPRPELFVKDNLHLSEAGYKVWNGVVGPMLAGSDARASERDAPQSK